MDGWIIGWGGGVGGRKLEKIMHDTKLNDSIFRYI